MIPANVAKAFESEVLARVRALLECDEALTTCIVAFSGGRDSTALLCALASHREAFPAALRALHVDHALQTESAAWAAHCATVCASLNVPCTVVRLDERPVRGESREAWARDARYATFAAHAGPGVMVLTAHHADDQAETFLLHALRGSGRAGLRGIAPLRRIGAGWLARPCLEFPGQRLEAYVRATGRKWIDDPSNGDEDFDRNFLRHRILPVLRDRWPAAAKTLSRASALQREADAALRELIAPVLEATCSGQALRVDALSALGSPLRAEVLRAWIAECDLPPPQATHLEHLERDLLGAAADRMPSVAWPGACVRRYAGFLHAMSADPPVVDFAIPWQPPGTLELPQGVLTATRAVGRGLRSTRATARAISVRSRRGGEKLRTHPRGRRQSLKHLLQTRRIPPWQRTGLPLVFVDDALAAVADYWIAAEFAAGPGEAGWMLHWQPRPLRQDPRRWDTTPK